MIRRIRRHPDVADDILDIAAFISRDSLQSALKFLDSAEKTVQWLVAHPGAGGLRDFEDPQLAKVRSWPVRGFRNHLILYEIEAKAFM